MTEQYRDAAGPGDPPDDDPRPPWLVRIWYPPTHQHKDYAAGAGTLLDDESLVVTCAHVVARALGGAAAAPVPPRKWLELDFPFVGSDPANPPRRQRAHVAYWKPAVQGGGGDIAWLALEGQPPAGAEPAPLRPSPPHDSVLRVFGFTRGTPSGDWAKARFGFVDTEGRRQLNQAGLSGRRIQQGFSGTAVWSPAVSGMVGMVVAADRAEVLGTDDRVSHAIPVQVFQAELSKLREHDALPAPPPEDVAEEKQDKDREPPEVERLRDAIRTLEVARGKLVRAAASSRSTVRARLPRVLAGLQAVETAIADLRGSDNETVDETVMETLAAIEAARIAYGQVKLAPSVRSRLREAVDKVLDKAGLALGERR